LLAGFTRLTQIRGHKTDFPREIAEAALGHKAGDAVERAYRRGSALEKRRELMQAWDHSLAAAQPARQDHEALANLFV